MDNVMTRRSTFQSRCQQEFRGKTKQIAGLRHIAHEAPAWAPSKEASVRTEQCQALSTRILSRS